MNILAIGGTGGVGSKVVQQLIDRGATVHALIRKMESARAERGREELQFSFLTSSIEFYEDYVDFLVAHRRMEDALKVAELSRARALVEGLTTREAAGRLSAQDWTGRRCWIRK